MIWCDNWGILMMMWCEQLGSYHYVECLKFWSVYECLWTSKISWEKCVAQTYQGSEGGCTAIPTVIAAHPSLTQFANFTLVNDGELWHWCQSRPLCPTIGNTIYFRFPSLRLLSCPICKLSSIRSLYLHNIGKVDHHFNVGSSQLMTSHNLSYAPSVTISWVTIFCWLGNGYIVLKIDPKSDKVWMDHRVGIYCSVLNPQGVYKVAANLRHTTSSSFY